MRFSAIFLGLTQRFDLILHILIVLDGPHDVLIVLAWFCVINCAENELFGPCMIVIAMLVASFHSIII